MRQFIYFVSVVVLTIPLAVNAQHERGDRLPIRIPWSITAEHDEIHRELEALTQLDGQTGSAARAVAEALHGHFEDEEEYALPPLGILQELARGSEIPYSHEVLMMAEKLERELPDMLAEHNVISRKLENLRVAAKKEDQPTALRFAEKLQLHALNEEQILYPTTILIAKFLRAEQQLQQARLNNPR